MLSKCLNTNEDLTTMATLSPGLTIGFDLFAVLLKLSKGKASVFYKPSMTTRQTGLGTLQDLALAPGSYTN